ncbi:MAG: sulfotransferase [Marinosulfonomonas sp.]|nr:sulfotransferase [Marinosulfonomonas sp.]
MGKFPEFLVIGAARSGTTALHSYLRQHPQVFMPARKEPNFFSFEGEVLNCQGPGADYINNSITDLETYRDIFSAVPRSVTCGEASPLYLFAPKSAERIKHHIPKARLVVLLRNPIEQAYSHFLYATKQSVEPEPDFVNALNLEEKRLSEGWQPMFGYSRFPRYSEQLARFFEHFPKEQIFIRTYEDFQDEPERLLQQVFEFIGVDPMFTPDMSNKPNAGGVPKNKAFQDFLMKSNPISRAIGYIVPQGARLAIRDRMSAMNMQKKEGMSAEARSILKDRLSDDIRALEKLIDRDLSAWLT